MPGVYRSFDIQRTPRSWSEAIAKQTLNGTTVVLSTVVLLDAAPYIRLILPHSLNDMLQIRSKNGAFFMFYRRAVFIIELWKIMRIIRIAQNVAALRHIARGSAAIDPNVAAAASAKSTVADTLVASERRIRPAPTRRLSRL